MNVLMMLKLLHNLGNSGGSRNDVTDEILTANLTHELAAEGVHIPRIRVQEVEAIPKTASGKSPLIRAHTS